MPKTLLHITGIGSEVAEMEKEGLLITFFEGAPPELADFCYTLEKKPIEAFVRIGDKIRVGEMFYTVLSVGAAACENFKNLGHITLQFDGCAEVKSGGAVHLAEKTFPKLTLGSEISYSTSDQGLKE